MAGATVHVVKSNDHPSLPERLRGEWMVIARQGDDETVALRAYERRSEAVTFALLEDRRNRRVGGVNYASGFYVLADDGSWKVN